MSLSRRPIATSACAGDYNPPMERPSLWQRPRVLVVITAISLLLWALILIPFAHAEPACRAAAFPTVRIVPQPVALQYCAWLGQPGHEACASIGTPEAPGLIVMPSRETARWLPQHYGGIRWDASTWNWAFSHEYAHAVCGLPAEQG